MVSLSAKYDIVRSDIHELQENRLQENLEQPIINFGNFRNISFTQY